MSVIVRDGEEAVKCAAEKVAAMFEATSDLGDWADGGEAAVSSKPPYHALTAMSSLLRQDLLVLLFVHTHYYIISS